MKNKIVIVGAGPSGLGCAYELTKKDNRDNIVILEKNNSVGGLARTLKFKNHYFDIGPHRFYTKNKEILKLWKKLLAKDFKKVKRLTRISYKNKLFLYPIKISDVILKLGIIDNIVSVLSYIKSKVFLRFYKPKTFEDYITINFGKKLFNTFFKTYTEKVWGIPCNKIGQEWAAQRIKNLNLVEIIKNSLFKNKPSKSKSLIELFYYPKKGAGQMYEKMANIIDKKGGKILKNSKVKTIYHHNKTIIHIAFQNSQKLEKRKVDFLFSSMPITEFIYCLYPKVPKEILHAANKLFYRDHITVNLLINKKNLFPDNWIYVHSPEVKMARVANYNNFSKLNSDLTAISVEYFTFKKNMLWKLSDKNLIKLAIKELNNIKLLNNQTQIKDAFVIKETESYPTYYLNYQKYFNIVKNYLIKFSNLQLIGRGGMYKYNNMDHAIYSGILAARNYILGNNKYDIWNINEDAEYLEESHIKKSSQR